MEKIEFFFYFTARVYGDPHIVTLDGHKYTFNGKGEFVLIQTTTNLFALQGRMEQVNDADGDASPGTVFMAIVARQIPSNTSVQFEVDKIDASLHVLLNGDEVVFDNIAVLEYENVVLLDKGNNTVQALFSSGANIEVSVLNGIINAMSVALPDSMKGTTSGLMGSYNNITSDDLQPKNGRNAISLESSLEYIHNIFGMTWIISRASESYFFYQSEENWNTYYFPDFVPMFKPIFTNESLKKEAKSVCGEDSLCLFDVAATKRVEIGAATMEGEKMVNTIEKMSQPIVCSPVCENGVCLENNTCSCDDGYTGDRCNQPILEVCDINPCQHNGNCSKLASSVRCICTLQYTGSLCQTKRNCVVQLMNSGLAVVGNEVTVEFTAGSSDDIKIFCKLDDIVIDRSCRSPLRLSNLSPGEHSLAIKSECGKAITTKFNI